MMIDIFLVILSILFVTALGFALIKFFNLWPNGENLVVIGASYGLGVGIISIQMYLYSRIDLVWNRELILLPWIAVILLTFIKNRHKIEFRIPKPPKVKKIHVLLLVLISLSVLYGVFEALIRPVSVWDGVVIWLYKSKVFFMDGTVSKDSLFLSDPGYPLVVSLFGAFIYEILGHVNDYVVLLTSTAFYIFTALTFFSVVKKRFGFSYALVFTLLFVTTQNFIRHAGRLEAGQADLPLGYFTFICALLLLEYVNNNKWRVLFLLSIFLGITGLVKSEGVFFLIAVSIVGIYQIYKTKLYSHLFILFFWLVPIIDWELYKKSIPHLQNSHPFYETLFSLKRIVKTIVGIIKEFVNIKSWNMLWIIYFYSLTLLKKISSRELNILNFLILSQLFIYFVIYLLITGYTPESSAERLYVHVAPLVFFVLSIVFSPYVKKYIKNVF